MSRFQHFELAIIFMLIPPRTTVLVQNVLASRGSLPDRCNSENALFSVANRHANRFSWETSFDIDYLLLHTDEY